MSGLIFIAAPVKNVDQRAYGAKMAIKYGGKDDGGALGCYCNVKFPKKAEADKALDQMKADGLVAWSWEEHVAHVQSSLWEALLRNHSYEVAAEKMGRMHPKFKIPSKV